MSETGEESRLERWELQMLVRLFDLSSKFTFFTKIVIQDIFSLERVTLVDYFLSSRAEVSQPKVQ